MGRPEAANQTPSEFQNQTNNYHQEQKPQEYQFQAVSNQSPETYDEDAPPPAFEENQGENYRNGASIRSNDQNVRTTAGSRGSGKARPPQSSQANAARPHKLRSPIPTNNSPQTEAAFHPPSDDSHDGEAEAQAFPPPHEDLFPHDHSDNQAFPPDPQDDEQLPQAFPPPHEHLFPHDHSDHQAFPPDPQDDEQLPQAFPPPHEHLFPHDHSDHQAFPPDPQDDEQLPHAFPPPQGPQAHDLPHAFAQHQRPNPFLIHPNAVHFPQPPTQPNNITPPQPNPQVVMINNTTTSGIPNQKPWKTGLFECMNDPGNALVTACFPCVTFGQIAEVVDSGRTSCGSSGLLYGAIACCIGIPCVYSCTYRAKMRSLFGLTESPAPDWIVHCFCECCALCQEYRELQQRGLDPSIGWEGNVARAQQSVRLASMTPPMRQTMMG